MRRTLLKGALTLGIALPFGLPRAQDYPARPVRMLVGFPPGSTTDLVARAVADALRRKLGQPFIVENRPGANGMLAAEAGARADPDGHTLLVANTSSITVNPLLYKDLRYDVAKDFAPISTVITAPMILMVNTRHPRTGQVRSLRELAEVARRQSEPLTYGSGGNGNLLHLAGAQLSALLDLKAIHVPYRGAAPMQTALLANEIDFAFNTLSAMPHIRAGTLRPLMVTADERWPDLPDTPSAVDSGLPAMNMPIWTGLLAPTGTPAGVIAMLTAAIADLKNDPASREPLEREGRIRTVTADAFARQIANELRINAEVIKRAHIRID
ncbi:MAG: tripartite tricarboxylate transporter substrate binding protein [Burkholderiaceae bacterium]